MVGGFIRVNKWEGKRGSAHQGEGKQDEKSVFYNLISKVTSSLFPYAIIDRSESLDPAHTQGERITQGSEYQESGITGGLFRSCLPALQGSQYSRESIM